MKDLKEQILEIMKWGISDEKFFASEIESLIKENYVDKEFVRRKMSPIERMEAKGLIDHDYKTTWGEHEQKPEGITAEEILKNHLDLTITEELPRKHRLMVYADEIIDCMEEYFESKQINLREELIAYDKFMTKSKWGSKEILSPEKSINEYLNQKEK